MTYSESHLEDLEDKGAGSQGPGAGNREERPGGTATRRTCAGIKGAVGCVEMCFDGGETETRDRYGSGSPLT